MHLEPIIIKLSKLKIILMLMGCIMFVTIGVLFVMHPTHYESFLFRNPAYIFSAGVAGILFFGLIGVLATIKLWDKSPGLIITGEGFTHNANAINIGFVAWEDITAMKEKEVARAKFLNIMVRNPQHYIDNQKNFIARKAMQGNYKKYGTPISISANGLEINYAGLKQLLKKKFKEYKEAKKVG